MNECKWEEIDAFCSLGEYKRFCAWIEDQIEQDVVEEISVKDSFAGQGFEERWFRCKSSNQKWRLVAPDGPFRGYWGNVE